MAPFVLDASVTASWCFTDEPSEYGRAAVTALENSYAVVPALWQCEVATALVSAERKKRSTWEGIERFFETLRHLLIYV